nr:MAG TPA: hypothetical protein [Caudoviricetes sp.]
MVFTASSTKVEIYTLPQARMEILRPSQELFAAAWFLSVFFCGLPSYPRLSSPGFRRSVFIPSCLCL